MSEMDAAETHTAEVFTTAEWTAKPGHEQAFVDAWTAFAGWAQQQPGAGTLRLAQDLAASERFVSFGAWADLESAHRWKSDPEFGARMAQVQEHVAAFRPGELRVVARVGGERSTSRAGNR